MLCDSSYVDADPSLALSDLHVENCKYPRGEFSFATWRIDNIHVRSAAKVKNNPDEVGANGYAPLI